MKDNHTQRRNFVSNSGSDKFVVGPIPSLLYPPIRPHLSLALLIHSLPFTSTFNMDLGVLPLRKF